MVAAARVGIPLHMILDAAGDNEVLRAQILAQYFGVVERNVPQNENREWANNYVNSVCDCIIHASLHLLVLVAFRLMLASAMGCYINDMNVFIVILACTLAIVTATIRPPISTMYHHLPPTTVFKISNSIASLIIVSMMIIGCGCS